MSENRFTIYGLEYNPFPQVAIANRMNPGPFVVFSKKFMENLKILIDSSIDKKAWGGIPLIGVVGSGKTRLLYEIWNMYRIYRRVKILIIENPGLSLIDFYAMIVSEVIKDEEFLTAILNRYKENLLHIITKYSQRTLEYPAKKRFNLDRREIIYDTLSELMNKDGLIFDKSIAKSFGIICFYNIVSKKDFFKETVVFSGPIKELVRDYRTATNFLQGHQISESLSARLKYERRRLDEKMIIDFGLKAIINVYRLIGYEMLFLLVDQFERIIEQLSTRRMLNLLDGYRNLIDRNLENLSAIFTCTTESWFESAKAYPSFKDRFTDPVEIPRITLDTARKIVIAYCDQCRISDKYQNDLFPFDEATISYILSKSPTVRDLLEYCHIVLFKASLNKIPKIDEKSVIKLL